MDGESMNGGQVVPPPASQEEPLAIAIKRFAMLDSYSSDDNAVVPPLRNRFDNDTIELSGLLNDSSDVHRLALPETPHSHRTASVSAEEFDAAGVAFPKATAEAPRVRRRLLPFSAVKNSGSGKTSSSRSASSSVGIASSASRRRHSSSAGGASSMKRPPLSAVPLIEIPLNTVVNAEHAVTRAPVLAEEFVAAVPVEEKKTGAHSKASPRESAVRSKRASIQSGKGARRGAAPDSSETALSYRTLKESKEQCAGLEQPQRTTRQAPTQPKIPSPSSLKVEAGDRKPPKQPGEGDLTSPLSNNEYRTKPLWTYGMKRVNGVYVSRGPLPNPTGLYERGVQRLQKTAAKTDEMRAKLEELERTEATFRPVISPRAKSLKRHSHGPAADAEASQQLRYRLQLLELPAPPTSSEHRHTPRLSNASKTIVQACRDRDSIVLPPGERLYQDFFLRKRATAEMQRPARQPSVVRSRREIEAHIEGLYSFEKQRQLAIASARDAVPFASTHGPLQLYVDPQEIVERLTKERPLSSRQMAAALLENDQNSFRPQTNTNADELISRARRRGLRRWVRFFSGDDVLPVAVLSGVTGPAAEDALRLAATLERRNRGPTEWSYGELAAEFTKEEDMFIEELWRRRPPDTDALALPEALTFHPCLDRRSAVMVNQLPAEQRSGPVYDRLYLSARSKQLHHRQQELEAEQAALEGQQRHYERHRRLQASWRAKEAQRLAAYRACKSERNGDHPDAQPKFPPQMHQTNATPLRRRQPSQSSRGKSEASPVMITSDALSAHSDDLVAPSPTPPVAPHNPANAPPTFSGSPHDREACSDNSGESLTASPSMMKETPEITSNPPFCEEEPSKYGTELPTEHAHKLDKAAHLLLEALPSREYSSQAESTRLTPTHPHLVPTTISAVATSRDAHRLRGSRKDQKCTLDVMLECAQLRDPSTVPSSERERLDRSQKRRLRELGRLLYKHHKSRIDGV